jgi:hypothetical protein
MAHHTPRHQHVGAHLDLVDQRRLAGYVLYAALHLDHHPHWMPLPRIVAGRVELGGYAVDFADEVEVGVGGRGRGRVKVGARI